MSQHHGCSDTAGTCRCYNQLYNTSNFNTLIIRCQQIILVDFDYMEDVVEIMER